MTALKWIFILLIVGAASAATAQTTYTVETDADAFLATGSPDNPAGTNLTDVNYGGAGNLVIASASNDKGEFQTIIRFNLSGAKSLFDTSYGSNNWTITNISLEFASNFGGAGEQPNNKIFPLVTAGKFIVEWLADDDWLEGDGTPSLFTTNGVSYDSLPELLSQPHFIVCTNTYTPPGDNVHVVYPLPPETYLVNDASTGGEVTFLLYAADDQIAYSFNSYFYGRGNQPLIHVTAGPASLQFIAAYFTNSVFHLIASGSPNSEYQIQDTTNLTDAWQTLTNVTADNSGNIQFDDTTASKQGTRFYRLVQ